MLPLTPGPFCWSWNDSWLSGGDSLRAPRRRLACCPGIGCLVYIPLCDRCSRHRATLSAHASKWLGGVFLVFVFRRPMWGMCFSAGCASLCATVFACWCGVFDRASHAQKKQPHALSLESKNLQEGCWWRGYLLWVWGTWPTAYSQGVACVCVCVCYVYIMTEKAPSI